MAATKGEVEHLLRKLFNGGAIERVPKNRKDADVFLALAAARVDSQVTLSEPELNEQLSEWLDGVADQNALDHVTLRRDLVDYGFVLRDYEGTRYRTNQTVIDQFIDREARTVLPSAVKSEVEQERARRRRANQS
jgi:hypothetical protein